jgi:hypothetical protein
VVGSTKAATVRRDSLCKIATRKATNGIGKNHTVDFCFCVSSTCAISHGDHFFVFVFATDLLGGFDFKGVMYVVSVKRSLPFVGFDFVNLSLPFQ